VRKDEFSTGTSYVLFYRITREKNNHSLIIALQSRHGDMPMLQYPSGSSHFSWLYQFRVFRLCRKSRNSPVGILWTPVRNRRELSGYFWATGNDKQLI